MDFALLDQKVQTMGGVLETSRSQCGLIYSPRLDTPPYQHSTTTVASESSNAGLYARPRVPVTRQEHLNAVARRRRSMSSASRNVYMILHAWKLFLAAIKDRLDRNTLRGHSSRRTVGGLILGTRKALAWSFRYRIHILIRVRGNWTCWVVGGWSNRAAFAISRIVGDLNYG